MFLQLLLGLFLSALIGLLAYARGSLTRGGVVGALITGTLIFGLGGIIWGILLIAFFVSSSILSHHQARAKAALADKFQKGSRRDLGQTLANGGWAALLALAFGLTQAPLLLPAFIGAIAAVTADTWATEIGVLSHTPPRLITTGKIVPVGTSGGITVLGTLTSFMGGLFIGAVAVLSLGAVLVLLTSAAFFAPSSNVPAIAPTCFLLPLLSALSGLAGSLFDSFLGATTQAIYFCDYDAKETERRVHSCGRATRRVRGWAWLDNDAVNFLASVFGSAVAVALWLLWF